MTAADQGAIDAALMRRCLALARTAKAAREMPFACVIASGDEVVAEAINAVKREKDVTRHAEMVAMSMAQAALGTTNLSRLSLYTTVEPCPMCSMAIRETRIRRVVYALKSPFLGGSSKWDILGDPHFAGKMRELYGNRAPEVVGGVLAEEVAEVWRGAHPLMWMVIKGRGIFVAEGKAGSNGAR